MQCKYQKKYSAAIEQYNIAISIIQKQVIDSISIRQPFLQSKILSNAELYNALYQKGYCELQYYHLTKNKQLLENSIKSLQKALLVSDNLRQHYNYVDTKLFLNKTNVPIVSTYIESLLNTLTKRRLCAKSNA